MGNSFKEWVEFTKKYPSLVVTLVITLIILLEVVPLPAVCSCAQNACQEKCSAHSVLIFLLVVLGLGLHNYSDVISAVAAVAVAIFTWTLWRSTEKLWLAGENQRVILDQQTEILRRQTSAQNPFVFYNIYHINIKRLKPDLTHLEKYKISLDWKNNGTTPAINVRYWIGEPAFIDYVEGMEAFQSLLGDLFKDRIFRSEGNPGDMLIGPGHSVQTDEFDITKEQANWLFSKKKRVAIWCVVRYGSILEKTNWFTEVALWLEFVQVVDPEDAINPDEKRVPFRVACLGCRYRESHD